MSCNSLLARRKRSSSLLSLPASAPRGYTHAMRAAVPRVAYLPDTFYEVNGVAHTSRQFEAFALRKGLPFFCRKAVAASVVSL